MVEKEAIRSRRRKRFLLEDEQRERAAVALISVAWRCHVRGRSRRQTSAAITVQRIFRGRLARRSLLERLAARTIQFHTRRFLRRLAKIRAELLTVATLRLQRAFLNRQRARCRERPRSQKRSFVMMRQARNSDLAARKLHIRNRMRVR